MSFSILEMSTLFVLLVYYIIILISALYNPSHCLFVYQIGGEVYAWFGCIVSFKSDALCCCFSALESFDYFNFFGFSTNVVYAENWFVCLVILLLYLLCICINFVLQDLSSTGAMMKNDQSDAYGSRAYTPYSYSWQVKIHDLCKETSRIKSLI